MQYDERVWASLLPSKERDWVNVVNFVRPKDYHDNLDNLQTLQDIRETLEIFCITFRANGTLNLSFTVYVLKGTFSSFALKS